MFPAIRYGEEPAGENDCITCSSSAEKEEVTVLNEEWATGCCREECDDGSSGIGGDESTEDTGGGSNPDSVCYRDVNDVVDGCQCDSSCASCGRAA